MDTLREKGIEKFSKIIMPGLILLIVIFAVFCLTLTNTAPDGTVRTGMQGLAVYLKPDFHGLTVKRFLEILLDAMSHQLLFTKKDLKRLEQLNMLLVENKEN